MWRVHHQPKTQYIHCLVSGFALDCVKQPLQPLISCGKSEKIVYLIISKVKPQVCLSGNAERKNEHRRVRQNVLPEYSRYNNCDEILEVTSEFIPVGREHTHTDATQNIMCVRSTHRSQTSGFTTHSASLIKLICWRFHQHIVKHERLWRTWTCFHSLQLGTTVSWDCRTKRFI